MNSTPILGDEWSCLDERSCPSVFRSRSSLTRASRRAFTVIEVFVAMAIIAVLSAVMFPVVAEQVEQRRVDKAITTFKSLADAVTAFRANVGMNPGRLVHLSNPILSTDLNSCGVAYGTPAANAWAGPYYTRQILVATGLPLGDDNLGRVQNTLVRTPAGVATPGSLAFPVTGIPLDKVTLIEDAVDGDGSATTGRVRWTTPADANGHVTLSYHVAINGC